MRGDGITKEAANAELTFPDDGRGREPVTGVSKVNAEIEKAERSYELNKAAELKYGKLPELQKELEEEFHISENEQEMMEEL